MVGLSIVSPDLCLSKRKAPNSKPSQKALSAPETPSCSNCETLTPAADTAPSVSHLAATRPALRILSERFGHVQMLASSDQALRLEDLRPPARQDIDADSGQGG